MFFPFLLFSKLDSEAILKFNCKIKNIFQNRIIKPNILGLQDPTTTPPLPNQIEQDTGDEEIQLAVTAKMCIDSDPTSISFIV